VASAFGDKTTSEQGSQAEEGTPRESQPWSKALTTMEFDMDAAYADLRRRGLAAGDYTHPLFSST
jgi:hypothetical protein